jgi:hypothetical protein
LARTLVEKICVVSFPSKTTKSFHILRGLAPPPRFAANELAGANLKLSILSANRAILLRRSARFNFVNFSLGETGEKHTAFIACGYEFLGTICAIP